MSTNRSGSDRQVRYGRVLGLAFVAAGFVAIGLGWNGMASQACLDCQFPYLLSGGATGLGLILFGGALLIMAQIRGERIRADARMQELIHTTGRMGTALALANGESHDGLVVAGRSTYHSPDCRLVKDKDLDKVTVDVAAAQGLTACRVCSPAGTDTGTAIAGERQAQATSGSAKGEKSEKKSE